MRFLRSFRGGSAEGPAPPPEPEVDAETGVARPAAAANGRIAGDAPTDEARSSQLMEEFEAGLSGLARQQVRFSRYAWEPPAQLDRRGRWVVTEATQGTGHDGRKVSLRAGEGLELDESGVHDPGRTAWRFVRVKDSRAVDLAAGPGGAWPDGLERPRSGAEG